MKVIIENYRGFEISFDTEYERFSFSLDETNFNQKHSFAACKANIDKYLKENESFKSFYVRKFDSGDKLLITGIRKDNRFILENKEQLSEYDEKRYILYDEKDDEHYNQIHEYEIKRNEYRKLMDETYKKIKGINLIEYKNYLSINSSNFNESLKKLKL